MKEIRSICFTGLVLTIFAFGPSLMVRNYGGPSRTYSLVASTWLLAVFGIAAGVAAVFSARDVGDFKDELLKGSGVGVLIGLIVVPLCSCFFGHWYVLANMVAYNVGLITTVFTVVIIHGRDKWLWDYEDRTQAKFEAKVLERYGPRG